MSYYPPCACVLSLIGGATNLLSVTPEIITRLSATTPSTTNPKASYHDMTLRAVLTEKKKIKALYNFPL